MNCRRVFASATMVAALLLSAALPSRAQVLDQVPSDALVVFKVANIKALSDKVASLSETFQITAAEPKMADPLGSLKETSGVQAGLKEDGEFAFVFVNPELTAGDDEKSFMVLVPVSDYAAFLGNFNGGDATADITQATAKNDAEPVFISHWGQYAALSPAKEVLALKEKKGLKLKGITAKEMGSKDAILFANFVTLRPILQDGMAKNRENIKRDMNRELANSRNPQIAKFQPVIDVALDQVLNVADSYIATAESATWGANLSDEGISSSLMTEFAEGSYGAKTLASLKNTDQSLLAGLPDEKYLVLGGSTSDPKVSAKLMSDFLDPIVKSLQGMGEDGAPIANMIAAARTQVGSSTGQTFGVFTPSGILGQSSVVQAVKIFHGDAKAITEAQKGLFESQQELMDLIGANAGQMKNTSTPGAKTIDGVVLDRYQTQYNMNAKTPQEARAAQMMMFVYGPEGTIVYSGAVDEKTAIVVTGVDDDLLTATIGSAKKNEDVMSKNAQIKAVAAKLPLNRMSVMYIPLDQLVSFATNYAGQAGFQMNLDMPQDLQPIGIAVSSEGNALRIDSYIPSDLVSAMVSVGMQVRMQMGGGGGRGAGRPGGL